MKKYGLPVCRRRDGMRTAHPHFPAFHYCAYYTATGCVIYLLNVKSCRFIQLPGMP